MEVKKECVLFSPNFPSYRYNGQVCSISFAEIKHVNKKGFYVGKIQREHQVTTYKLFSK